MNESITTLGKSNQKFLKEQFGYTNVKQAYKDFGVNNPTDAYEAMALSWNFVINLEKKKKQLEQKKKSKEKFIEEFTTKLEEKKKKREEKNKLYVTTFILELHFIKINKEDNDLEKKLTKTIKQVFFGNPMLQIKIINGSVVSNKKDIRKKINEFVQNEINKLKASYIEVKKALVTNEVSTLIQNPKGMENIKMKDAYAFQLSNEKTHEWDTKSGRCVFDYLIYLYGDVKGFKKIMNYEYLENEFGEKSLDEGVNIKQISNFCKKFGLSYYALDGYENTISFEISNEKKTNHAPSLMFKLLNKHMYPIEDYHKRKSITSRNREVNIKSKNIETSKNDKDIIIKELIYPNQDELKLGNEYAIDYIKKCNKIPYPLNSSNLFYEDGHISRMVIDDKIILTFPIDEDIKQYFINNKREYQGECLNKVLNELWLETYGAKMYECEFMSDYNNEVYNILNLNGIKNRVHYGATRKIEEYELENIIGCDIEKCYSSLLLNPLDEFMVLDLTDEIDDFTNEYYYTNDEELPFGLYYVTTSDLTILHQSNIYSNKILDYAKNNGIKFKIQHQILCNKKQNTKSYFGEIIKNIISKVKDISLIKKLINSITGCLGKTQSKHLKVGLNSNIEEIWENDIMKNVDKKDIYFNKLDNDLFVYGETIKTEMTSNALPIYIQILDWSNIKLHQMIKEMGGECIFRKTDCCVVINGNHIIEVEKDKNNITKTWGSFRNETYENIRHLNYDKLMSQNRHIEYININNPWNIRKYNSSSQWKEILDYSIENGGMLIEGRAGTGKTYIILNGIKNELILDEKECRLAFTNKASQNLNGTTIHKALAINSNENSNMKSYEKYKNKKLIVVDEIGMINKKLWKHLCLLKRKNPKLIFILMGDYRQCLPIEDVEFNYFNSSIVKFLVNNNKIELTEKQRYDEDLWNFLEDYYEKGIVGNLQHTNMIDMNKKMICYFNQTRDEINDFCMNKCKTNDSMYLEYERTDYKDKAKSAYIYKDLPVMSIKNNCNLDIINTDEFIVVDYNNENITLKRLNEKTDDLTIEIKDFHKYFVVNYISTTHKLQGSTITEDLLIFDWYGRFGFNSSLKDDKHVGYTALSRVKSLKQIYIHN